MLRMRGEILTAGGAGGLVLGTTIALAIGAGVDLFQPAPGLLLRRLRLSECSLVSSRLMPRSRCQFPNGSHRDLLRAGTLTASLTVIDQSDHVTVGVRKGPGGSPRIIS